MLDVYTYLRPRGIRLLGPNCPGALSPGRANVGIIPAQVFAQGGVGLVSRSGTLTYQIGAELAQLGLGNSTIVGIGGDPVVGTSFIDALELFQADDQTEIIVMVGEIGGNEEEKAADYIAEHVTKPVFSYIAGFTAPPGKTMGHAGAIISGSSGTAAAKKEALEARGVQVGTNPTEVAQLVAAGSAPADGRHLLRPGRSVARPAARRRASPAPPSARSSRIRPARWPTATVPATRRCGSGSRRATATATRRRVLCTNGSLQGLAFLAETLFAGSGGRAIVEAPTYDRAILILRRFGATVESVDLHTDGLDVDAIEAACEAGRVPGLVYTIPNFQNPGGDDAVAGEARAAGRAGPRARLPGARGRPVRRAALRRRPTSRGCSTSTRAPATSSTRRRSRRPWRRASAPARWCCRRSCTPRMRKLAIDTYIGPTMLSEAIRRPVLRGRELRARRGPHAGRRCAERRDALRGRDRPRTSATASVYVAPAGGYFLWVDAAGRRRRRAWPTPRMRPACPS